MRTRTTISLTEARKRIFDIAEEVQKPGVYYTFTENGRPKAVVMSANEFESWAETLEVSHDFPDLEKDTRKAEGEFEKGDYLTLEELLNKEGFVLAEKSKNKYEIQRSHTKKSTKRNK
jgi:prevent-host-death family protein